MKILTDKQHTEWMQAAGEVAARSTCQRARCGTVLVKDGEIIGRGYNNPPQNTEDNRKCDIKETLPESFKSDKTGCVHAEQRAIMDALRKGNDLSGSWLYFTRIDEDGSLLKSGQPYCTICSKLALDSGVDTFVLWHEDGITAYDTQEYNDLSFEYEK